MQVALLKLPHEVKREKEGKYKGKNLLSVFTCSKIPLEKKIF